MSRFMNIFKRENQEIRRDYEEVYHELIEFFIISNHGGSGVAQGRVLSDHILRLSKLSVDPRQLIDGRRDAEAGDVCGEQLLVERMSENLRFVSRMLPIQNPLSAAAAGTWLHHHALALVQSLAAIGVVLQVGGIVRERGGGGTDHGVAGGGDVVDYIAVVPVEDRAGEPLVGGVRDGGIGSSGVEVEEIGIGGGGSGVGRVVRMGILVAEESVVEPIRRRLQRVVVVVVMVRLRVRRGVAGELVRQNGAQTAVSLLLLVGEVER